MVTQQSHQFTRVLIESPFRGSGETEDERAASELANRQYAAECVKHSLSLGEAPYASHLFYTQFLDDSIADERQLGIDAGLAWGDAAAYSAVYIDLGISTGMRYEIEGAKKAGRRVVYRSIYGPCVSSEDCDV